MFNPVNSYRIQFNRSFTFRDLEKYLDYLNNLGVVSIYASPIFKAVPDSDHGYDVTDPTEINPELGTAEDYDRLSLLVREKNMGWIQDVVPNHMAYHTGNKWISDVLEKGNLSDYFTIFDFEPEVAGHNGKIMLPFLGSDLDKAVRNNELQICLHEGGIALSYFDNRYPLNFKSFKKIFEPHIDSAPECFRLIWTRYSIGERTEEKKFLNGDWHIIKQEIESFCKTDPEMETWTGQLFNELNNDQSLISEIIMLQHYEPCHWKDTSKRINYRRFFTVNGLICLRTEDSTVLEKHHRLVRELVDSGNIRGLRVDHVDGLRDPSGYLRRLRALTGKESYNVVEKILEPGEEIPVNWPVEGTSGYDFLAMVNNLMLPEISYGKLNRFYRQFTGETDSPGDLIYNNKKLILTSQMNGELDNIFSRFEALFNYAANKGLASYNEKKSITRDTMKRAIGEFMIAFPVYRLYPEEFPLYGEDYTLAGKIFRTAVKKNPDIKNALMLLKDLLLKERKEDQEYKKLLREFIERLMQYTGPLTAKGVEDTSMYRYNSFIAGNEVGDSLHVHGIGPGSFHKAMTERLRTIPLSMNATSTHDTKRGEDVRARLNAIGDMPDEWIKQVKYWKELNEGLKFSSDGEEPAPIPSANDEYFIYQTIAGTFPFDNNSGEEYKARIKEYLVKALREAKQHSNWENPDEGYEKAVCDFTESILDPQHSFLSSFIQFFWKLSWRGVVNSLSQLTLKCCSPGIPDIYRGTELWDLSMVDPDNRRSIDYSSLNDNLESITRSWTEQPAETVRDLYGNPADGRIKLLLTSILLNERKNEPELFRDGDYIPLEPGGKFSDRVFGFIRRHKNTWLMCITPLHSGSLSPVSKGEHFSSINWKGTFIELPQGAPGRWTNIISKTRLEAHENLDTGDTIMVEDLFRDLPVAVLKATCTPSKREAGILMHISSLPGDYGTGDLGDQAYRFADFLAGTSQSYWQTLPLSPVTKSQGWSPYSSPSAFAGNPLLISPRQLYKEGLLNLSDLDIISFRNSSKVNHQKAGRLRSLLLGKAWSRLKKDTGHYLYEEYEKFCKRESYWLDDYALYTALKQHYGSRAWNRWPSGVRNRDEKTLRTAEYEYAVDVMQEKFNQFIFDRQWKQLKAYANNKGIRIFGDIPFYVSYDSADVWANQHLFNLGRNGKMKTVAGVPPDYFNSGGQLWNMPVFNWVKCKDDGYGWWLKRLGRNLELFDLLRLDHFRAFSAYWEVPAGEKTAVNGRWISGPGFDFFNSLQSHFPSMPFVAEDLGDIDQSVYDLRDTYSLPGMQVLQFAFGRDMPSNIHAPHNHSANSLVYTGTHDNNTLRGWYEKELDKHGKQRLEEYTGKKIRTSGVNTELIKMAYASPARIVIIPMQDYMGLGREARMNIPSTGRGNWLWKIKSQTYDKEIAEMIKKLSYLYGR